MRLFGVDITPAAVCMTPMVGSDAERQASKDIEETETEMQVVQESDMLDAVEN